ncbi:MAG: hypothetical protein WCI29_05275 [Actinomycetes bacterium]
MATIKATCPMCGDVDLGPRQVQVLVVEAIEDSESRRTYSFTCTTCGDHVVKVADEDTVQLLGTAGVKIERVPVPDEAREQHRGRPLGYDDLLDFVLWLDTHEAIADELAAANWR